jgi:hypothetical protein
MPISPIPFAPIGLMPCMGFYRLDRARRTFVIGATLRSVLL